MRMRGDMDVPERLLQSNRLQTDEGVRLALSELGAFIKGGGAVERFLDAAVSVCNSLPFVISVASSECIDTVAPAILGLFPISAPAWSETLLGWRIFLELFRTAYFLPVPRSDKHEVIFREMNVLVANVPPVLTLLPRLDWSDDISTLSSSLSGSDATPEPWQLNFGSPPRLTKGQRKQAKKWAQVERRAEQQLDKFEEALAALGHDLPVSQEEADVLAAMLLFKCRNELRKLIQYFRRKDGVLREAVKRAYVPVAENDSTTEPAQVAHTSVEPIGSLQGGSDDDSCASARQFSQEGFGPWAVYLSPGAQGDIRMAERRDAKMHTIFVKKLMELSKGFFSSDNQKHFTDRNTAVPVFEAKMTRDTRLIYQVDIMPDFERRVLRQAIYVFTIRNHRQIDKRLWTSVSHHWTTAMARFGDSKWELMTPQSRAYVKRCTYRAPEETTGDVVIRPGEWPMALNVEDTSHHASSALRDEVCIAEAHPTTSRLRSTPERRTKERRSHVSA
ncbi:unnamed protein product [Peniophora sp. CBMAI 1063]|nr:unnamed protein product [Peniophora sp. CBMAI 1063]